MIKKARLTWRFIKYSFFNKRYPFCVNIKTDYGCNSKCIYCNFWKYPKTSMTTEQVLKIIDEAAPHAFLMNIYGGEPLLRKDIGKIIDHMCKKEFLFQSISTNGILVKENIEHLKKLDLVMISLDGPRRYNDKVRCTGHFDRVMEAIDALREHNVPVMIVATLCKHNLKHAKYLMDLCMEKRVRLIFQMYRKINDVDMSPDVKEFKRAMKLIQTYPQEIFPYPKVYQERYMQWPDWGNHKCTSGRDFCSINPRGDMFQCEIASEDYDRRTFLEGEKDDYENNVFRKGYLQAFEDLDLSRCVKCWTCDRAGISYIMNNRLELLKNVLFYFKKKSFLKRNVVYPKSKFVKNEAKSKV